MLTILFAKGGKIVNKSDLLDSIVATFAMINRADAFQSIQKKLKGENVLLARLFEIGGRSTPGALADFLDVTAARVTAIIHALEHKDLVERLSNGADKRKVIVQITDKGKTVVEGIKTDALHHSEMLMEKIGESDTHEFLRIMNKIIEAEKGAGENSEAPQPKKEEVNHVE